MSNQPDPSEYGAARCSNPPGLPDIGSGISGIGRRESYYLLSLQAADPSSAIFSYGGDP